MISSSKKIPLKTVTVQITCQVETYPTELYSRIIFLEEANKNNGKNYIECNYF